MCTTGLRRLDAKKAGMPTALQTARYAATNTTAGAALPAAAPGGKQSGHGREVLAIGRLVCCDGLSVARSIKKSANQFECPVCSPLHRASRTA